MTPQRTGVKIGRSTEDTLYVSIRPPLSTEGISHLDLEEVQLDQIIGNPWWTLLRQQAEYSRAAGPDFISELRLKLPILRNSAIQVEYLIDPVVDVHDFCSKNSQSHS